MSSFGSVPSFGKPATPREIVARIGSLDVSTSKRAVGNRPPDALGDLERLLRRGLGQEDGELLPAEPGGNVVMPQLLAEDFGDPLEDGVAGEVAVRVVDVPEEVEVGHDDRHRPVHPARARQLLA